MTTAIVLPAHVRNEAEFSTLVETVAGMRPMQRATLLIYAEDDILDSVVRRNTIAQAALSADMGALFLPAPTGNVTAVWNTGLRLAQTRKDSHALLMGNYTVRAAEPSTLAAFWWYGNKSRSESVILWTGVVTEDTTSLPVELNLCMVEPDEFLDQFGLFDENLCIGEELACDVAYRIFRLNRHYTELPQAPFTYYQPDLMCSTGLCGARDYFLTKWGCQPSIAVESIPNYYEFPFDRPDWNLNLWPKPGKEKQSA